MACSVSTSDAFRVTLEYFSEDVVKRHVHALDYASDAAREAERLRDKLSRYALAPAGPAVARARPALRARSDALRFTSSSRKRATSTRRCVRITLRPSSGVRDGRHQPNIASRRSRLRVVDRLAKVESRSTPRAPARLGKRVSFEYVPEGGGEVDYTDEETFLRALRATKRTLVTQRARAAARSWGLSAEVPRTFAIELDERGLTLIDAPARAAPTPREIDTSSPLCETRPASCAVP